MRVVLLTAILLLIAAPAASAAERLVTTTADSDDNVCNAHCSVREALFTAGPGDTVRIPAGTFQLTLGELLVVDDVVTGAGARETILRGDGTNRVISTNGTSTITGVTVTNGGGAGVDDPGDGGGILISGALTLVNSTVAGNSASGGSGGGISIGSGARLDLVGSTVSGNVAQASFASGGGIHMVAETDLAAVNSTISGNSAIAGLPADALGGGVYANGYTITLNNVTIANNTAGVGGGVYFTGADPLLTNTILADNSGSACANGTVPLATSHHNLVTDGSCAMTGPGNVQGVAAQLGALANNGGPTDTRALSATSPAVNAGSGCAASDQRGVTRDAACDIGAFEYRAATLTVVTTVVNDHGFSDVPADFTVRAAGNAAAGSAGTSYTLAPGTYAVAADPRRGYTFAYGGACGPTGSITLADGAAATCTVVANDPSPESGKEVNALPARGTVKVKLPGSSRFRELEEGEQLPTGTTVDTLKGRVTLIAAGGQQATFYDGIFRITQGKGSKPLTTLTLFEKLSCKASSARATAAAKKKKTKRRLWGDGSGKFRVKGKHSAATVVGTKWLVEDRCTSTLTRVDARPRVGAGPHQEEDRDRPSREEVRGSRR